MIDPSCRIGYVTRKLSGILLCREKEIDAVSVPVLHTREPGIGGAGERVGDILPGRSGMMPECVGGSVVNKQILVFAKRCVLMAELMRGMRMLTLGELEDTSRIAALLLIR